MEIRRRRFLGFMAGAAAGAATGVPLGYFLEEFLSSAEQTMRFPREPESYPLSICDLCPAGCGVRARRVGNRIVKLAGNPLHPISGGRLCCRGQAALEQLYHPDRVEQPLRREGPRGSLASFRTASWDEAMEEIAARLRLLREQRRTEGVVLIRGNGSSLDNRVASHFLRAFGSPNDIAFEPGDEAIAMAMELTQGVRQIPAYDIAAAEYLLSIGSDILGASTSPVYWCRAYGDFRQERATRRGRLIHLDPRLSVTASSADEWIPLRPGTHAIVALGLAGVIVREELYDKDFVNERTVGFAAPNGGLERLLREQFRLEVVAEQTGISVNVLLRIAREFAAARGLAIGPRKGPLLPGTVFDHLAVQVLNALVGNIDQPGGVLLAEEVPLAPWPGEAPGKETPHRIDTVGSSPMMRNDVDRVADALLSRQPYPIDVLFVTGADPVFCSPSPDRFAAAVERVPLVVSFDLIPSDTGLQADWILPRKHFLERWEVHANAPGASYPLLSVAEPATEEPIGQSRSTAEVFMELAARLDLTGTFPGDAIEGVARSEVEGLYEARRGTIIGTEFDEAWIRMMENAGWWVPGYKTPGELWGRALEVGGWWDPFYDHSNWTRVLRTESGRFDLRPELLARFTHERSAIVAGSSAGLTLILFEPLAIEGGSGAELPHLQALLQSGEEVRWVTWGEIHPDSAEPLGIRNGERISVSTGTNTIIVRARITPNVVPGVIAIPLGLGKKGGGRWAEGVGSNPLRLLARDREPISDLPRLDTTTVRVEPLSRFEEVRS